MQPSDATDLSQSVHEGWSPPAGMQSVSWFGYNWLRQLAMLANKYAKRNGEEWGGLRCPGQLVNAAMDGLQAPHVRPPPSLSAVVRSKPLSLAFPSHRGQAGLARHVGGDGRQGATPPAKLL